MKKIALCLLSSIMTVCLWAGTQINGIYYLLDNTSRTAEVTYNYLNNYIGNIIIPDSVIYCEETYIVTSIGTSAFQGCSGLTSVTIPESVTSISYYAFQGCSGLTSIAIPNSVTRIEHLAFYLCSGLISITIPNSVTSIGDAAFSGCSGLTSITIPNSVTGIGDIAFAACENLTKITVEDGNEFYDSRNNCNAIIETSNNTLVVGCRNTIIPNSVTSIGNGAFSGCSGLTSVTIPNSVTSIGSYAFSGCSDLTSVTIPESVTSISYSAFARCSGLTSITIPNSVTSIGESVFSGCSNISSVEWNAVQCENFSNAESAPFYDARNQITSFTFGEGVTKVPDYLCYGMDQLSSVTLPAGITHIGNSAFQNCTAARKVTMGEVAQIGTNAFNGCTGILSMTIAATTPPLAYSNSFTGVSYSCIMNIPCSAEPLYRAAQYWNIFHNYSEGYAYSLNVTSADATQGYANVITEPSCSNSNATILATATPGYVFSQWSDGNTDNPRTLYVMDNMSLEAQFEVYVPSQLSVNTSNTSEGAAYGSGTYNSGEETTIYAIPTPGYYFTGWNDGDIQNPREIVVGGDSIFTASFAPVVTEAAYEVNVSSVNPVWGSATVQEAVVLTAIAESGYKFMMWSDGNTDNPRAMILTEDVNLMAIFTIDNPTSVSSVSECTDDKVRKELIHGQVYIIKDGQLYDAIGRRVE